MPFVNSTMQKVNVVEPAMEVTPTKKRKKRASTECEGMKMTKPKAQNMGQTGICPKVKTSVKAMSQLADPADMLQCVFHLDQCIPLWPQYTLSDAGSTCLKVAPAEQCVDPICRTPAEDMV